MVRHYPRKEFRCPATCLLSRAQIRHQGSGPTHAAGDHAMWLFLYISAVALLCLAFVSGFKPVSRVKQSSGSLTLSARAFMYLPVRPSKQETAASKMG